jgi:hypothetical protein
MENESNDYYTICTFNLHERKLVQLPFLFLKGDIIDLFIDSNGVLIVMLYEEHKFIKFFRFALRFVIMSLN